MYSRDSAFYWLCDVQGFKYSEALAIELIRESGADPVTWTLSQSKQRRIRDAYEGWAEVTNNC